jgi:NADP-dependent 3-hydroxy acid dehydrogenase YdfG
MADRLDGTVALITGASSGIGRATALELAALGAAVSLVGRRSDRLEDLATAIRGQGGTALVLKADITDEPQAREVVERTAAELGRLDTLVNNNLLGLLYCTHAALPLLLDAVETSPRRVADIVNISSVAGRTTRSGSAVYNATKHGVGAFTEALRQEVTRRYLRVSVVEPGAVETELVSHNRPEIRSGLEARFDEQERMQASDIAEVVSFIVTRPRRTALNEVLVRPTDQER